MRASTCPSCGANLTIDDEDRDFAFCQYCGGKIMLDDYRSTQRIVDEAKLKQAETDRIIKLKEIEIEERWKNQNSSLQKVVTITWLAISLIILSLCIIKWTFQDDFSNGFHMLFYLGVPVIGGGAYLIFKVLPEKERERVALKNGGIKFPRYLEPFDEQNVSTIEQALKDAGFTNIYCVNLHDLTLGIFQKPGRVEQITVDDVKINSGGRVYYPDSHIVITYHGR